MDLSILKKSEPRAFQALLVAITALTLLAAALYLFKKPIREYQALRRDRALLQNKVVNNDSLDEMLVTVDEEVRALKRRIEGENPAIPPNELIAHNIEKLDLISSLHKVELIRVKPDREELLGLFKKIPFKIEVAGEYFNLYRWLFQVERELGPMVIKKFEIRREYRTGGKKRLNLRLNMASYRLRRES